jgi:hypothetical protein
MELILKKWVGDFMQDASDSVYGPVAATCERGDRAPNSVNMNIFD